MKAVLTLIFVLFFGAMALANTTADVKVETIEMDVVLVNSITSTITFDEVETTKEDGVARLYKFKNSRIKKALSFTTKRNRAKLS